MKQRDDIKATLDDERHAEEEKEKVVKISRTLKSDDQHHLYLYDRYCARNAHRMQVMDMFGS